MFEKEESSEKHNHTMIMRIWWCPLPDLNRDGINTEGF